MNRRLVVAALVALLAFSLAGCGGGEEEAAPPPAAPAAEAAPPAELTISDRSVEESAVFEPFPAGAFVPDEIKTRLEAKPKQPMILFFYDDAQLETDDARAEIVSVRDDNSGAVDLLEYNLGKYTSIDESGVVKVDEDLAEDEESKQVVSLARELGVNFTPFVVIVDDQGYIIYKWRGYIDAEMLGRQVARTKD